MIALRFLPALALLLALPLAQAVAGPSSAVTKRPSATADSDTAVLRKVINGSWRDRDNRSRDRYRHPVETLVFFGLTPRMNVIEITPGGGWYSEILAPYLKAEGHYTGAMFDPASTTDAKRSAYYQGQWDKLGEKFAGNPAQYDKARLIRIDPANPQLGEAGSADMVLTFRNVHNWMMADQADDMFAAFFKVLKPGGVLGVVEHRARDVAGEQGGKTGYVATETVVSLATAARFELESSSQVNANRLDSRDHPNGVWTLPPSMRHDEADRAKYLTIGESDRMTLRFVKPKAATPAN